MHKTPSCPFSKKNDRFNSAICQKRASLFRRPDSTRPITADQKASLQPGEEVNENALPSGLNIVQSLHEQIDFGWSENEECLCGVSVKTKKAKDGQSCKAKLDKASYGCECG